MKKMISICVVCLMLCTCLIACAPKTDQTAIVGEWVRREIDSGQVQFRKYTFYEDGTANFQHSYATSIYNIDYTYEMNEGNLILISDLVADDAYSFSFNDDFTVLTLTADDEVLEFHKS